MTGSRWVAEESLSFKVVLDRSSASTRKKRALSLLVLAAGCWLLLLLLLLAVLLKSNLLKTLAWLTNSPGRPSAKQGFRWPAH